MKSTKTRNPLQIQYKNGGKDRTLLQNSHLHFTQIMNTMGFQNSINQNLQKWWQGIQAERAAELMAGGVGT